MPGSVAAGDGAELSANQTRPRGLSGSVATGMIARCAARRGNAGLPANQRRPLGMPGSVAIGDGAALQPISGPRAARREARRFQPVISADRWARREAWLSQP